MSDTENPVQSQTSTEIASRPSLSEIRQRIQEDLSCLQQSPRPSLSAIREMIDFVVLASSASEVVFPEDKKRALKAYQQRLHQIPGNIPLKTTLITFGAEASHHLRRVLRSVEAAIASLPPPLPEEQTLAESPVAPPIPEGESQEDELQQIKRSLEEAQALVHQQSMEISRLESHLERLRKKPYRVPLVANAVAILRDEYERLVPAIPSAPSNNSPASSSLPTRLDKYCQDLLALCTQTEAARRDFLSNWFPTLAQLDTLVYGPVPHPTLMLALLAPTVKPTDLPKWDTESWHRLYLLGSRAQEWMHTVLTGHFGLFPLFAMRGDPLDFQWHDSSDREFLTTDDPALDGCVESLIRHGYVRQETVLRRARVRHFRAVGVVLENIERVGRA